MVETLIKELVKGLINTLPEKEVKAAIDKALDFIEEKVENSSNKLDDMIVLPLIKKIIREPFGIEDND